MFIIVRCLVDRLSGFALEKDALVSLTQFFAPLTEKGELFGWGNSEYAQFRAVTEEMQLNVPRRLKYESLKGKKVVDVACGGTTCAVLDGKQYTLFSELFDLEIFSKSVDRNALNRKSQNLLNSKIPQRLNPNC